MYAVLCFKSRNGDHVPLICLKFVHFLIYYQCARMGLIINCMTQYITITV